MHLAEPMSRYLPCSLVLDGSLLDLSLHVQLNDHLLKFLGFLLQHDLATLFQLSITLGLHVDPIFFCDTSLAHSPLFLVACLHMSHSHLAIWVPFCEALV